MSHLQAPALSPLLELGTRSTRLFFPQKPFLFVTISKRVAAPKHRAQGSTCSLCVDTCAVLQGPALSGVVSKAVIVTVIVTLSVVTVSTALAQRRPHQLGRALVPAVSR